MIMNSPDENAQDVIKSVYSKIFPVLQKSMDLLIRPKEMLDTLADMMRRFGFFIARNNDNALLDKQKLMDLIFNFLLKGKTIDVKSRASLCMGQFAIVLTSQ
jgi:hypothetical protein